MWNRTIDEDLRYSRNGYLNNQKHYKNKAFKILHTSAV